METEDNSSGNRNQQNQNEGEDEHHPETGRIVKTNQLDKPSLPLTGIRNIAKIAGVKRMKKNSFDQADEIAFEFASNILKSAYVEARCDDRDVIETKDILIALKRHGFNAYGYPGANQ